MVGTILPLATALILPRLSKVGELQVEVKDRNARASGKADAVEGDDGVQEVGGGTIPADEGGQGDEGRCGVYSWRPHRKGVVGVTRGQGLEEVAKVEGRMEVGTPSQTKMGWGDYQG